MMKRNAIDGGVCFAPGESYVGTATLDHQRQKVFAVVARRGDVVSFAHVSNVRMELVEMCDGTEIVKVKDADGFNYFLSAKADVDVDRDFAIVRMCKL